MSEEQTVPAHYPDFADANFVRKWDGSQEAHAWAALWHYRRAAIAETVRGMATVGGEDADLVGLTAFLWGIGEEEASELIEEFGEKGRQLRENESGKVRRLRDYRES